MGSIILTKNGVYQAYITDGLSDTEVAKRFGVCRTAVVHFRKKHGIPSRIYSGEVGEGIVACELQRVDLVVINMNMRSKIHPYDLLVNGVVRIDVKSATLYQGHWRFSLSQKAETGIIEGDHYIRLNNGRMRKQFAKVCDFIILCGIQEGESALFVIPTKEIPETQQTICINQSGLGKWWKWQNSFDSIKGVIKNRRLEK